jgi:phytoene dehydrogenase-like protein
MTRNPDVIIIGAGLGGLSAGALLGSSGMRPLVLEKGENSGGRVTVIERDGFAIDYGIHASLFAERSAAGEIMRAIGSDFRAAKSGISFCEDGRLKQFMGKKALSLVRTKCLSRRNKIRLFWHFARSLRKDANTLYPVSVKEWLDDMDAEEEVRDLITGFCVALCASTSVERLSIGEIVQFVRTAISRKRLFGYPLGGWNSILKPMEQAIKSSGEIRTKCAVDTIITEDGKVKGVVAGGEEIKSDLVVYAIPAQQLPPLLGEALPKEYARKLEGMRPSAGVWIDYALKNKVADAGNVIITANPPTLGWFISNLNPSSAPESMQYLTTFAPLQFEELGDGAKIKNKLKELEENYIEIFPEIERNTLWKLERASVVNGAELNVNQTRNLRPDIRTPIENLFLVGDTTCADGAGGEIAFNSAKMCWEIISARNKK